MINCMRKGGKLVMSGCLPLSESKATVFEQLLANLIKEGGMCSLSREGGRNVQSHRESAAAAVDYTLLDYL